MALGWGRLLPLAALLSGGLWGLSFARHPGPFLPWVALVPLPLLMASKRPGLYGALHGLGAWLVSIGWIAPTLEIYGALPKWLSLLLLVVLALYLGSFQGAFAWLGAALWRLGGISALVGLPALWVGLEWLRSHLFSGFPWNLAAYAWVEVPGALPLSAWCGSYGLSFLAVFANVALARGLWRRRWETAALGVLLPALLLALGARFHPSAAPGEHVGLRVGEPIRIVQPNIKNQVEYDPEVAEANYRQLLAETEGACDLPSLILWPESAAWPYAFERDERLRRDLEGLLAPGCSLLLNSPRWVGEKVFNSAFLVDADGSYSTYDKNHLVPYGEYVPLGELLPFVGHLARQAGWFSASDELRLLPWRQERVGVAICFEITFPGQLAAQVRQGATVLATITNDAWYGDTAAPWQHLRAAQFRAAENSRPLLRAAITGISAFIGPDGRLLDSLGVGEEGVLSGRIEGRRERTLYSRFPPAVPLLCSVVAVVAIGWSRRRPEGEADVD